MIFWHMRGWVLAGCSQRISLAFIRRISLVTIGRNSLVMAGIKRLPLCLLRMKSQLSPLMFCAHQNLEAPYLRGRSPDYIGNG